MRIRISRKLGREEGNTLVEMALVSCFIFLPMLIGIFEISLAVYGYNFVSVAARQATRYAAVRGAPSCVIASTFPDCNLGPAGGTNPTTASGSAALQTYVRGLAYPGINQNNITVTATWWSANTSPGATYSTTAWDVQCTTTDLNGSACNSPRDAVKVMVSYNVPLPFWKTRYVTVSSTSQLIINE
jgi:Flp pilus assembly protein TadG